VQLANPKGRDKAYDALVTFGPVAEKAALQYINHPDEAAQKKARSLCRLLKVPADHLLAQTLTDIADTRGGRVRTALVNLAHMRVDEANRAKVSEALNASLLDPNVGIREDAVLAVKTWGTPQNTDALLKVFADFQASGKGSYILVIDTLATLKDPKAAPALAQGLTHASEREAVAKALFAIGSPAEDAVIPFLQNIDRDARLESCQILAEIGTSKSVQPLQNAIVNYGQDRVFFAEANLAIQKIAARK
jgi:HEAT repeat protein